ncbi:hypothetical protein [Pontibacter ramchanderi]|uniref:Uncharacterized protein n=1 Tax=Pontibacter ramchanderi TaxID=1179743 RepID=A0A2N3V0U7_9BACT|nr:hypothetical protein [Pontibacter ramchanderi]PKV75248.1 hypothetical protein BD749_0186 [Pontibacter ramchanderi]
MLTPSKHYFKSLVTFLFFVTAFLFLGCESESNETPEPLSAELEANAGPGRPNSALHNKTLADIRSATARYHRIEEATAAGYVPFSPCVSHPVLGGMGYHYVNPLLIDGNLDPRHPEALLYEPQKNGRMQLVGVEFIVRADQWSQNTPPMLGGQELDAYINSPANPLPFDNYQLHAWVWKHNPSGMHFPFNPTVSCEFAAEPAE